MKDTKPVIYTSIKPTWYFKLKIALISVFKNERWYNNFLIDIEKNISRYIKVKHISRPPDYEGERK